MYQVKEEQVLMLTEEQITQMESQGGDMSSYREIRKKADEFSITKCEKLKDIEKTPRDADGEVVKMVCKPVHFLEMLLKKKSFVDAAVNGPLVYAGIVQAHNCLFQVDYAGQNFNIPTVFVFAMDEKHRTDAAFITQIVNKLRQYKAAAGDFDGIAKEVPDDCRDIIRNLFDVQSQFCLPVPAALTDGADVWCATHNVCNAKYIPYTRAPKDRLLPFIVKTPPNKKQRNADLLLVPGQLYRGEH